MLPRQPLKTRANVVELVDFTQDRFENHGYTAFSSGTLSWGGLQMDWLRSEDLKEEKVTTTSLLTIAVPRKGN